MLLVKLGFSRLSVLKCRYETDKIALPVFRLKKAQLFRFLLCPNWDFCPGHLERCLFIPSPLFALCGPD